MQTYAVHLSLGPHPQPLYQEGEGSRNVNPCFSIVRPPLLASDSRLPIPDTLIPHLLR